MPFAPLDATPDTPVPSFPSLTGGRESQIGPTLGQAVCNRVAYQGVPGAYSEQVTSYANTRHDDALHPQCPFVSPSSEGMLGLNLIMAARSCDAVVAAGAGRVSFPLCC